MLEESVARRTTRTEAVGYGELWATSVVEKEKPGSQSESWRNLRGFEEMMSWSCDRRRDLLGGNAEGADILDGTENNGRLEERCTLWKPREAIFEVSQ
jgi:hypothetical protein